MKHLWIAAVTVAAASMLYIGVQAVRPVATLFAHQSANTSSEPQSTSTPVMRQIPQIVTERDFAACSAADWENLSQEQQDYCGKLNHKMIDQERTAQADPAAQRQLPTRAVPTLDVAAKYGTPLPEGVIPEEHMVIEPLHPMDLTEGSSELRSATSAWRLGAVIDSRGFYYLMTLWASPPGRDGRPDLGITINNGSREVWQKYGEVWECPEAIGAMTITAISGQRGIVSFTSESGQKGSFDLATATWNVSPSP